MTEEQLDLSLRSYTAKRIERIKSAPKAFLKDEIDHIKKKVLPLMLEKGKFKDSDFDIVLDYYNELKQLNQAGSGNQ